MMYITSFTKSNLEQSCCICRIVRLLLLIRASYKQPLLLLVFYSGEHCHHATLSLTRKNNEFPEI